MSAVLREMLAPVSGNMSQDEATCRESAAALWRLADTLPVYPSSDKKILELFRELQYAISVDDFEDFIDRGSIPSPKLKHGKRAWFAVDILCLLAVLDLRRQWRPTPSQLHDAKKSKWQIAFERAKATGETPELLGDMSMFDLRDCLLLLTKTDNRELREGLLVAVKIRLGDMGIEL